MQRVVEIRSVPARLNAATVRELYAYREVLWAFIERSVRVKYKQAIVGVGWVVLQPLLAAVIFSVVLGRYAHVPSDGKPYLLFVLCGMVPWTYFSTAVSAGVESVVKDAAILRKVYFPREVLPLAAVGAAVVDLLPSLLILIAFAIHFGAAPGLAWLALPVPLLLLVITAASSALLFGALNVYYRDVRLGLPFLLQIGLFASAVVWPLSRIPSAGQRTAWEVLNPVVAAIDSTRRIVTENRWPELHIVALATAWSVLVCLIGYHTFKRLEHGFADQV